MAATTQQLILKGFQIHSKHSAKVFREKIKMIASHYSNVNSFLEADLKDFDKLVFKIDDPHFKLTNNDVARIQAFQNSGLIDENLSVQENVIKTLVVSYFIFY
jgi:hypothetical protein